MKTPWRALLLAVLLAAPGLARAQAWQSCTVSNALPVVFGNYNPLQYSDVLAQSSLSVNCIGFGTARVSLLAGLGGGGIAGRAMQNGAARLRYQLYRDAARTQVWGDGTAGSSQATLGVFIANNATWQLYARLLQRQDVPVGAYTDTVQVRVDF
ncbi:MAG: spore coat U domain-containing protein [Ramlibacter sp.]